MLVHPDKNTGSPLASGSFKKVQCAYEVLSDSLKKRDYDEQLRNEESKSLSFKFASTDSYSGESRHIQCMKCGNLHIWICTNRTKWKARCQDCCQYHQARDGDGWVEYKGSLGSHWHQKVEIPPGLCLCLNQDLRRVRMGHLSGQIPITRVFMLTWLDWENPRDAVQAHIHGIQMKK